MNGHHSFSQSSLDNSALKFLDGVEGDPTGSFGIDLLNFLSGSYAALFRFGFLFPKFISAPLTAFLTNFRSSVAPCFKRGKNLMNFSSSTFFIMPS